jgi:hypothetical protein
VAREQPAFVTSHGESNIAQLRRSERELGARRLSLRVANAEARRCRKGARAGSRPRSVADRAGFDRIALGVALAGHWQPARDLARLVEAWSAFGATTLGPQLALNRPLAPTETAGSETLLRLRTQLDGAAFAAGLAQLLAGQLGDLTL